MTLTILQENNEISIKHFLHDIYIGNYKALFTGLLAAKRRSIQALVMFDY